MDSRPVDSKWKLHMSCLDIVINKEKCPEPIATEMRLKLDEYWDGTAIRVIRHIEKSNNWTVLVQPTLECSTYIAMSYCWKKDSPKVCVEGIQWKVEEWNLKRLLKVYENINKVVSYCKDNSICIGNTEQTAIWCDAVCIDQRDDSTEKEEQVRIMGKIYRKAGCVIVPCTFVHTFPDVCDIRSNEYVNSHDIFSNQIVTEEVSRVLEDRYLEKMWIWLRQLALEDWWSRPWTLQEACCSRVLLFMAEDGSMVDASTLHAFISTVRECMHMNLLKESLYSDSTMVDKMVSQFLKILSIICVAQYCPLLPAAEALIMSKNRKGACRHVEDNIYSLLGIVGVRMHVEYNIGLREATKRFYNECIAQGDHSVVFCIGEKLHRWQMRIDSDIVFYQSIYFTSAEQNVNIEIMDDSRLKFSFNGKYSATPIKCVYIEDGSIPHLQMGKRLYRVLKVSIELGFGIVESYNIFDTEIQEHIVIMCFVIIASIQGDEMLDINYIESIFNDMKTIVLNSGPYLIEHRDSLLDMLSKPEVGKGVKWLQGRHILRLIGQCKLTKDIPKETCRHFENLCRTITHYADRNVCTVALAVFENNACRVPLCLVLCKTSILKLNSQMWVIPTGYSTGCSEPLLLVGLSRKEHNNIEAEYIGIPVVRRGLSLVIKDYEPKYSSLTFM